LSFTKVFNMIYVVSYHSPDIDGAACAIGYTEISEKLGTKVLATYFGDRSKEVEFVKKYTGYFPLIKHSSDYPEDAEFVVVDTSDPEALEKGINPEKVREVYDHRELVFTEKFKNAKLNIEKVGSCATLITELFKRNNLIPSPKVAIYLYSAIISNTVNFKNTVTTQRDIEAANWLKPIAKIPGDYIQKMFEYKSKIESWEDLKFILDQDYATKVMGNKNLMMAQIEIAKLEAVVNKYWANIREWLEEIKKKEELDYTLFTGIDIVEGFNILIVVDEESDQFFSKALGMLNIGAGYKTKEIIMRKQIWPKVEKILTS